MISRTKRITNDVTDRTANSVPRDTHGGSVGDGDRSMVGREREASSALDAPIAEPTLDRFLDGNPKVINSWEDYKQLVSILRTQRARDIAAEAKKGKKDVKDSDDTDNDL